MLFPQFKKLLREVRYEMHTVCAKEIHLENLDRIAMIQDAAALGISAASNYQIVELIAFLEHLETEKPSSLCI